MKNGLLIGVALLAIFNASCRDDVNYAVPDALPGTTWEFDDFYITFVSTNSLTVHAEDPGDVLAEGAFSMVDGFIEIALDDRVRAGSWDGERLIVDGMVGRYSGAMAISGPEE